MSMTFTINNSPFFGKEGKFVTSRHIKERLDKELEKNLAMKVEPTDLADHQRNIHVGRADVRAGGQAIAGVVGQE